MKKYFLIFSFLTFGAACVASGYYIAKLYERSFVPNQPVSSIQNLPSVKQKSRKFEPLEIPILGCAITNGECECYGRNTDNFSFSGDGKLSFEMSVCENYIKHSGGSQYLIIERDKQEFDDLLKQGGSGSNNELRYAIRKGLMQHLDSKTQNDLSNNRSPRQR